MQLLKTNHDEVLGDTTVERICTDLLYKFVKIGVQGGKRVTCVLIVQCFEFFFCAALLKDPVGQAEWVVLSRSSLN